MSDSGPASGTTPSGGWRHRPRPVRVVRDEWASDLDGRDLDVSSGDRPDGSPPPEACPWLFLAAEPNARAGFVTDTHRCELRPDVVPGPGHQLAYCLEVNHISCPQLRSYEGRRQAGAVAQPEPPTMSPAPDLPLVAAGAATPWRAEWMVRAPWILAGGLAALGLALVLALIYSAPSPTAVTPPPVVPTAAPPATPLPQEAAPQPPAPTPSTDPLDQTRPAGASANPPASGGAAESAAAVAAAEPTPAVAAAAPPAGNAAAEVAAAPALVPYVVVPGDTLLLIAWRFGIPLDDLLAANGLSFQSTIYYGQQLLLPVAAAATP